MNTYFICLYTLNIFVATNYTGENRGPKGKV